jgi:hypothetical protein
MQNIDMSIINEVCQRLNRLYSKIPETEGCQENLDKCTGRCCRLQTPSITFCEFLNFWKYILKNWEYDDIIILIQKSVDRYLNADIKNGCVLFDEKTYLCKCHETRSFNCRSYAITPDEEFEERKKHLEEYAKNSKKEIKILDQCNLVRLINGSKLTTKDMDEYFEELMDIEKFLESKTGTKKSYLMPHEHILIYNFTSNMMSNLSTIRMNGTPQEKLITSLYCADQFKEYLDSLLLKGKKDGTTETKN